MEIFMKMEKETKNTVRFTEILNSSSDSPKIGTLYIPKATLKSLGWNGDKEISVTIEEK